MVVQEKFIVCNRKHLMGQIPRNVVSEPTAANRTRMHIAIACIFTTHHHHQDICADDGILSWGQLRMHVCLPLRSIRASASPVTRK